MATKTDLITRALTRMGVVRVGQPVPARLFKDALEFVNDYLLELDEDLPLDFDPTADDEIPDERMSALTALCANYLAPNYGKPRNIQEIEYYKRRLYALIYPDDHISSEPMDF